MLTCTLAGGALLGVDEDILDVHHHAPPLLLLSRPHRPGEVRVKTALVLFQLKLDKNSNKTV